MKRVITFEAGTMSGQKGVWWYIRSGDRTERYGWTSGGRKDAEQAAQEALAKLHPVIESAPEWVPS